jgi:hypothetical protein
MLVYLEVVNTDTLLMLHQITAPGRLKKLKLDACLYSIHNLSIGPQITPISPTSVRKTTLYESRRKLGQPLTNTDRQIEEKYEVTVSSKYDESGLKILSSKPMTATNNEEYVRNIFNRKYIFCFLFQ